MVKEKHLKTTVEELKNNHGTLDEIKDVESQIIHDFGSVGNLIDTFEESFKLYLKYLRGE